MSGDGQCYYRHLAYHLWGDEDKHGQVRVAIKEMHGKSGAWVRACDKLKLYSFSKQKELNHEEWTQELEEPGSWGNADFDVLAKAYFRENFKPLVRFQVAQNTIFRCCTNNIIQFEGTHTGRVFFRRKVWLDRRTERKHVCVSDMGAFTFTQSFFNEADLKASNMEDKDPHRWKEFAEFNKKERLDSFHDSHTPSRMSTNVKVAHTALNIVG